jgi:hypothetical protein
LGSSVIFVIDAENLTKRFGDLDRKELNITPFSFRNLLVDEDLNES